MLPTRRQFVVVTFLCFLLLGCISIAAHLFITRWSATLHTISRGGAVIQLLPNMSLRALAQTLESEDVIDDKRLFFLWVRLYSDFSRFQAGPYRFEGATSPAAIAQTMTDGAIFQPLLAQLVVREGATVRQVADEAQALSLASAADLLRLASDPRFLHALNVSSSSAEGYLFPATYPFFMKPSAKEILQVMITEFWKRLPDNYAEMAREHGLTLQEAVIFASLIERETRIDDERAKVSEVIWRRLRLGIPLAIDASIIYGIPDFDGNLRRRHLNDALNPYNTRIHKGLPPTPICSPATASLLAVFHPTDFGYMYYVLDPHDGSRHVFTKTLREHNTHVRELVNDFRRRQKEHTK